MISRNEFLKASGLVSLGLTMGGARFANSSIGGGKFQTKRPAPKNRNFTSEAVEARIEQVTQAIDDPELAWIFENCFPNTLDTTVDFRPKDGKPDTFVITGDIEAMWLRDSSAQVWPYLPLADKDKHLQQMLAGVINRQTNCIHIDPYANAFNKTASGSHWKSDLTEMKPSLHERKWEIDSLCYPVRLGYGYWKQTGDEAPFDDHWRQAMKLIIQTFKEQQRKEDRGPYTFQRKTPRATDTVPLGGYGRPVNPVGLICSIFRPSDDATVYPFLVPSNLFAVTSLRQMSEMLRTISGDTKTAQEAEMLADEVEQAVKDYAIIDHPDFGQVYAYEVDANGNHIFMDDANVPSLLSLPYLGAVEREDEVYQNTRRLLLSEHNPYFFDGEAARGIGSIHVDIDMIWPMSIIMQALTSADTEETQACIHLLKNTHGETGFMHESFHKDNPTNFTREWFAWANTLFGELISTTYDDNPQLLG
jgi:meiotically up-regulated gene 157 (Mug157) protein